MLPRFIDQARQAVARDLLMKTTYWPPMYDGASGSGGEERKANLRLHKNDIVGGVKVFLLAVLAWQPLGSSSTHAQPHTVPADSMLCTLRTLTSAGFSLRTREWKRGSH